MRARALVLLLVGRWPAWRAPSLRGERLRGRRGRAPARGAARVRRVPGGRARWDPTGGSTPPASRTSPRSPRTSTWFRGATTVFDSTTKAVPAILDAQRAAPGHGPRLPGPPAQRVHAVRLARLPTSSPRSRCPRSARPACARAPRPGTAEGGARPPARRRAAGASASTGSTRCARGAAPDPLHAARAAAARALDLPPLGPPEPAAGQGPRGRRQPPDRVPRPGAHRPQPPAPPPPGGLGGPRHRAADPAAAERRACSTAR